MRNNNIEIMGTPCVSNKENKEKNNNQIKEKKQKFSKMKKKILNIK